MLQLFFRLHHLLAFLHLTKKKKKKVIIMAQPILNMYMSLLNHVNVYLL